MTIAIRIMAGSWDRRSLGGINHVTSTTKVMVPIAPMRIGKNSKINLINFLGFSLVNSISFSLIAILDLRLTESQCYGICNGRVWFSAFKMHDIRGIANGYKECISTN
ncbi:hypothetical protein [Rossellomorea marisflavi]|uniref:hypothetical protein n=1 Tax=Rossellomorea marisflavi TaxID=189381 RepID=UPI0009A8D7F8|nr:hypothetical protein [Rossellomorea marisflavi]